MELEQCAGETSIVEDSVSRQVVHVERSVVHAEGLRGRVANLRGQEDVFPVQLPLHERRSEHVRDMFVGAVEQCRVDECDPGVESEAD